MPPRPLAAAAILLTMLIFPVSAAPPATQPAASWSPLYADEPWYKDHPAPEKIFAGVLEREPEAMASTMMRAHAYKLGGLFIYPAEKNPALEKLVGQKVEIKGKPYFIELEGQSLREIWPAAIRAVPAASQPAATQAAGVPVPFDAYSGYGVANIFEPNAEASYLTVNDPGVFQKIFHVDGNAEKPHHLPDGLFREQTVVVAVKRGRAVWQFAVDQVTLDADVLTIRYHAVASPRANTGFASPLIVSVPRGRYAAIEFIEDGQLVKRLAIPAAAKP